MIFVDTNYFLRYIIDDGSSQHQDAVKLFLDGARSKRELTTSYLVIFEIFWVLGSNYRFNKKQKIKIVQDICRMNFINLSDREIFNRALGIYQHTSLEFEDSYNISFYQEHGFKEFATFDKKITKYLSSLHQPDKSVQSKK